MLQLLEIEKGKERRARGSWGKSLKTRMEAAIPIPIPIWIQDSQRDRCG